MAVAEATARSATSWDAERMRVRRARTWGLGLAGLVVLAGVANGCDLGLLTNAEGIGSASAIAQGLATPDLSASFLSRIATLTVESLGIAALGLVLALVLGIPLALLASQPPRLEASPGRTGAMGWLTTGVRWLARTALTMFRAVPDLLWAYLFVRVAGLGPLPFEANPHEWRHRLVAHTQLEPRIDPDVLESRRSQGGFDALARQTGTSAA